MHNINMPSAALGAAVSFWATYLCNLLANGKSSRAWHVFWYGFASVGCSTLTYFMVK